MRAQSELSEACRWASDSRRLSTSIRVSRLSAPLSWSPTAASPPSDIAAMPHASSTTAAMPHVLPVCFVARLSRQASIHTFLTATPSSHGYCSRASAATRKPPSPISLDAESEFGLGRIAGCTCRALLRYTTLIYFQVHHADRDSDAGISRLRGNGQHTAFCKSLPKRSK